MAAESNLHGLTVALTASRENLNENEPSNPRLTPVPPPSLDMSRGDLLTPEPQYETPPDLVDYQPEEGNSRVSLDEFHFKWLKIAVSR